MKIQVNEKPLSAEEKEQEKQKQLMKEKFPDLDALMSYVLDLEKRINELEIGNGGK